MQHTLSLTSRVLSPEAPLLELLYTLRLVSSLPQSRLPQSFVIGLFKYASLCVILFSNSLNLYMGADLSLYYRCFYFEDLSNNFKGDKG